MVKLKAKRRFVNEDVMTLNLGFNGQMPSGPSPRGPYLLQVSKHYSYTA